MGILLGSGYFLFISTNSRQSLEDNFLSQTNTYAEIINKNNALIESHVNSLSLIVLNNFNYSLALKDSDYLNKRVNFHSSYFKDFLNESHSENPAIVSVYLNYNVEDFHGLYENWYIIKNNTIIPQFDNISSFYPSNPDVQWYYGPKMSGAAEWTEAYIDSITKIPMISYVKPIYFYENNQKNFVGVVGIVLLGALQELLQEMFIVKILIVLIGIVLLNLAIPGIVLNGQCPELLQEILIVLEIILA